MDEEGTILKINKAFTKHFGYDPDDLTGKNFSILFTEKDKEIKKPEREIQEVITQGASNDENYLVHKDGNKIWVSGESVLAEHDGKTYLLKIVHNIHAQKQLERFLLQSHEFIETVFESVKESALIILDSHLRVVKVNTAFKDLFQLEKPPAEGCRLTEIDHPFWQRSDVKQETISFLVAYNTTTDKIFEMETRTNELKRLNFQAKLVEGTAESERKLLVMIKVIN